MLFRKITPRFFILTGLTAFALLAASRTQAQNILTNGDFSAGFSGWSHEGPELTANGSSGNYYINAGAAYGENGSVGDLVSQSFNTTPGSTYKISVSVLGYGFPGWSDTYLSWNNSKVLDLSSTSFNTWTLIQTSVTATSLQSIFAFGSYTPYNYDFDNASVTLTPVPEPSSTVLCVLGGITGVWALYRKK